ncbi:RCC1 domain-containing protein 1 isoform X3 [Sturnira hondurensis]|uniref:RCC1 domain-containing protein 1 isoform X3 n=1 Tax=Sturnira hondurensis TaxID=192404 RepID=UPI001879769B|nr:RCC1 domain-containing protein 1 isoform X3 [Sturnira hondurensis]
MMCPLCGALSFPWSKRNTGTLPHLRQFQILLNLARPLRWRLAAGRGRCEGMAEERRGSWFGFGFCGFGQALGSGRGQQVHSPEPLRAPGVDADTDVCRVSASWSYTAFLSRECLGPIPSGPAPTCPRLLLSGLRAPAGAGQVQLSGSARGAAEDCRDAWASETLLVVLRDGRGPGPGAELQAWAPGSALCGEPLWAQTVVPEAQGEDGAGDGTGAGRLPLLPGACAYVSPLPPFYRPLAPELRARRLELGTEHVLLLDEAGQVYSWGGGRHGQLGHGTLEAEPEPRLLEALQGLRVAEVAAGGWHSVCVSATGLSERGPEVTGTAGPEGGAPAPFIAVQPFPALLDLPLGSDAVKASCGSRHTAVVTRAGELYTWGWGKYGQLGHGDTTSWDRPCRVEYFIDKQLQAMAVSCGPWNTYVYAVQREKS